MIKLKKILSEIFSKWMICQLCIVITIFAVGEYLNVFLYSLNVHPYICIIPLVLMLFWYMVDRLVGVFTGSIEKELKLFGVID